MKVSDLHVQYQTANFGVKALDGVSIDIPTAGYTLGIVGESGSGKSTLAMSMMNTIEPPGRITGGSIEYDGKDILRLSQTELRKYRWGEVAMVYQSAMNSLNPVKNVSDPIVEVLRKHLGLSKHDAVARTLQLISEVGLDQTRASDYPHELSGGMRQRIVIALALALSPKLLIADEPTSALDVVTQRRILQLLKKEVSQKGLSLVFITHEISLLKGLVENAAVMYSGEVVEVGPVDKVLSEPLHPYTEMLIGTLITLESKRQLSKSVGTDNSNKMLLENSCRYANRCKYAFERCRLEKPKLREVTTGRKAACHKYN